MDIINTVQKIATQEPQRLAFQNMVERMTYGELEERSDKIAAYLTSRSFSSHNPILVYGHKSAWMLACFLGVVKAGHAYIPIDISNPAERTKSIIDEVKPVAILATEPFFESREEVIPLDQLQNVADTPLFPGSPVSKGGEPPFYIIYTSGSTGKPKGVPITRGNLQSFIEWGSGLFDNETPQVFLNQAPYSFDLSVMDLALALGNGHTIISLDKETQSDYAKLFDALAQYPISVWVSTPSFADVCLADRSFDEHLLGSLQTFLFCGEVLTKKTAKRLMERFPKARIINTYGPTESTVAITSIEVTKEHLDADRPIPIGRVKKGSQIRILKNGQPCKDDEVGEIFISGDTLTKGYYQREDLTAGAFSEMEGEWTYRSGDLGYRIDDIYYCVGRLDSQIKLNGYRIELADIEENLMKMESVDQAAVLPILKQEKVRSLTAYYSAPTPIPDHIIRQQLLERLPEYMIPKKFVWMAQLPKNQNGKIDRKALKEY